jgi:hypothetical protein
LWERRGERGVDMCPETGDAGPAVVTRKGAIEKGATDSCNVSLFI